MKRAHLIISLTLGLLMACEPTAPPTTNKGLNQASEAPFPKQNFIEQGAQSLQQLQQQAIKLNNAVSAFLTQSDQAHWHALQQQWLNNHQQWHHSAFYLQAFPSTHSLQTTLHSTPITPGYLDHIEGYPHSGIVHDSSLAITAVNIRQQHRRFSDDEIALGIHALEFLIWGRQLSDYTEGQEISQAQTLNGLKQYQLPTPRRRAYLKLLVALWQQDIDALLLNWQEHPEPLSEQHPASLPLFLSRQLGHLANNQHSEFSHDQGWQLAVLSATQSQISEPLIIEKFKPLIKTFAELKPAHDKPASSEQYASINQQLGELMLAIQNHKSTLRNR